MEKVTIEKDIVIIGAGPAGLTAALYAGRLNLNVILLENAIIGGQIANATQIENYPGIKSITGQQLISNIQNQVESFGVTIDEFDSIERLELHNKIKLVETANYIYKTQAVIIATGMTRRKLPLKDELKFTGKGIHYCELCDGHMYQDKVIAVVGGGNSAVDSALFLTKFASKLYLIHRSQLKADVVSIENLNLNSKIELILETEITKLFGDTRLRRIEIVDKNSNVPRLLDIDAIFVNIGVEPNNQLFKEQIKLDSRGLIIAGEDCQTNIEGVFAAGDIRTKKFNQLTTAFSDGTVAALLAEKYIHSLKIS